uniref:LisH domain-containing protein n=1 Tax=Angiostrongylus cantonensis TaxID=6313 RepID=A0A0K0DD91_ANGCA
MSAEFKDELASFLIEKLRDTEVFKFIQSLIRESVERIIGPNTGMNVKELSEQKLICHSMIYHYLISAGYRAAAEVMQAECYELPAKPDPQYEQTKEKIREEIIMSASKAVERKHELMKVNEMLNDEVTDEEEDDEESKQGESETKLSTSSESTTAESETAPELPPLTTTRPKPEITSIKSIDFDIPLDELSDIESIAGIDQLLESGRSDSISF